MLPLCPFWSLSMLNVDLGALKIMIMVLLILTVWFFNYGLNAKDSSLL